MGKKNDKDGLLLQLAHYRFGSIFFKYFILVMFAVFVPAVFSIVISINLYDNIREKEREAYAEEVMSKLSTEVDNMFNNMKEKMIVLAFDKDIEYFFAQKNGMDKFVYDFEKIYDNILQCKLMVDSVDEIYLFTTHGQKVISFKGLFDYIDFEDKECLEFLEESGKNFVVYYLNRNILQYK